MFTKKNSTRITISLLVIISLLFSSTFVGLGNDIAFAEAEDSSSSDAQIIEDITEPTQPDADYDGYIVKIDHKKTKKIDKKEVSQYETTADKEYVMVEEPDDALDFVDPNYIEYIEPNYVRNSMAEPQSEKLIKPEGSVKAFSETYYNYREYDLINAFDAWAKGFDGRDTGVAVFDTGMFAYHDAFRSTSIKKMYNFLGTYGKVSSVASDINSVKDGYSSGHGTPVSGLVAANGSPDVQGIAFRSDLYVGKVITDSGEGSVGDFIQGLSILLNQDGAPDVLNMSFGATGYSRAEYDMIAQCTNQGTIAIASAGNEGHEGSPYNYPANYSNVIAVGSIELNQTASYFSTRNTSVMVTAPGSGVVSVSNVQGYYVRCDGTSFSSPIVAGAAALTAKKIGSSGNRENHNRFLTLLTSTSKDAGITGYDINTGYGILDVDKLTQSASSSGINTASTYQIAYEPDGGTFGGTVPTTFTKGQSVTFPKNITKKGYKFSHWVDESGKKVTGVPAGYANDYAVFAVWKPKAFKLKFKGNGGKVKAKTKKVKYETPIGTMKTPKKRSGYNFLGWYTKKKGGKQYYKGMTFTKLKNVTLYAHWTKKNVVKFNPNKGVVKKYGKSITKGKKYGSLPKPTRKGYKFKGWYTKKKGGSKVTSGTKVKKKENITLYARWKKSPK